jgi:hypothetical protein
MSESALVDEPPWSLNIPSKTLISVEVVSMPQKADQWRSCRCHRRPTNH